MDSINDSSDVVTMLDVLNDENGKFHRGLSRIFGFNNFVIWCFQIWLIKQAQFFLAAMRRIAMDL